MLELDHGYWWLAIAMLISGLELMLGTYYLLAVIGGAALTGIIALVIAMSWWTESLLFAIFSIISLLLLLRWKQPRHDAQHPDDISRMHGRSVEVTVKVAPRGRVRHRGVEWNAEAEDGEVIEVGDQARVTNVRGSTLYVRKGGQES